VIGYLNDNKYVENDVNNLKYNDYDDGGHAYHNDAKNAENIVNYIGNSFENS